jgi:hypothetical protein
MQTPENLEAPGTQRHTRTIVIERNNEIFAFAAFFTQ